MIQVNVVESPVYAEHPFQMRGCKSKPNQSTLHCIFLQPWLAAQRQAQSRPRVGLTKVEGLQGQPGRKTKGNILLHEIFNVLKFKTHGGERGQ